VLTLFMNLIKARRQIKKLERIPKTSSGLMEGLNNGRKKLIRFRVKFIEDYDAFNE